MLVEEPIYPRKDQAMQHDDGLLIETALLAGILILENGGETFRVEETVVSFCRAGGYENASAIAFPTGIFLTVTNEADSKTSIRRINKRGVDLYRLSLANDVSRKFVKGEISLAKARDELEKVSSDKGPKKIRTLLASAFAAAFFAVLFGGDLFDGAVAFVAGFVIRLISMWFKNISIYNFAVSFIGGAVIATLAVCAVSLFQIGNVKSIIVGATMPILPGLMLTSAIRDSVMGDLIAGASRLVEALLIAVAIAAGVGIVLSAYISMGGAL